MSALTCRIPSTRPERRSSALFICDDKVSISSRLPCKGIRLDRLPFDTSVIVRAIPSRRCWAPGEEDAAAEREGCDDGGRPGKTHQRDMFEIVGLRITLADEQAITPDRSGIDPHTVVALEAEKVGFDVGEMVGNGECVDIAGEPLARCIGKPKRRGRARAPA